jgi:hypothetical protein
LNASGIEQIALEDLRTLLAEFIGPGIDFVYERANGNTQRKQMHCNGASGRSLLTACCACNQDWMRGWVIHRKYSFAE